MNSSQFHNYRKATFNRNFNLSRGNKTYKTSNRTCFNKQKVNKKKPHIMNWSSWWKAGYLYVFVRDAIIQIRYVELRPGLYSGGPTCLCRKAHPNNWIWVHVMLPRRLRRLYPQITKNLLSLATDRSSNRSKPLDPSPDEAEIITTTGIFYYVSENGGRGVLSDRELTFAVV